MLVLALDTTTRAGSVALVDGDRVVDERDGDPSRTHAERLPAEVLALCDANGVTLAAIDLFAIASGPGSFTGLRIGIATMQGLALVRRRPIVGVPALEALALLGSRAIDSEAAGTCVAAWMDAHRREVFSALYKKAMPPAAASGHLIEVEGPTAGDPTATLQRWQERDARPATFIGDGAALYAEAIERMFPKARVLAAPPLAAAIARLAMARAARGEAGHPAAIQPLYVRRPDAELARESARPPSR